MLLTGNVFRRRSTRVSVFFTAACIALVHSGTAASGQYNTGFEPPEILGTTFGTDLNGQAGFYNPLPSTSVSALAFAYVGNSLGLPLNPGGGHQFVVGVGPSSGFFVRSQRNTAFGGGAGRWTFAADIAIAFHGALPAAQNIGSLTTLTQGSPGVANVIMLARWTNTNTANFWNADYGWFDVAGNGILETLPNAAFHYLAVNRWYRWSTTYDLDSNRITEVSISDLAAGSVATYIPIDRYLIGGGAGSTTPTGFRLFAGNTPGNTIAIDNICIFERNPPSPDPMTFEVGPHPVSDTAITMTATLAVDETPPIEYFFLANKSRPGATSSTWQTGRSYTDFGLTPDNLYIYQVKARDGAIVQNETALSNIAIARTLAAVPAAPILNGVTTSTVDIEVLPNGNPTYTLFAIQCVSTSPTDLAWLNQFVDAGGNHSASEVWQTDAQWGMTTIVSMQPATTYGFAVKARDQTGIETSFGPTAFVSTLGGVLGDCDGNGLFEVPGDLPCFVDALLGIDTMPPGGISRSDLNGDGAANGVDIPLFVGCAVAGCP